MRQDFSEWTKRLLSIENLKLDINNPRFSYQTTKKLNQTEIVKFLIDHYKVYELAKDIALNGYLLGEEPWVCKEENSFVVLEGNRRMAACKILLNPFKYLPKLKAQIIENIGYKKEKIECYIAPSRKEADILIYRRHNGIPLDKWSKISQDAYFFNLFSVTKISIERISKDLGVTPSEVRKSLRRYHVHQYAIRLFKASNLLAKIAQDDFPITNFERFYDTEKGAIFLGISFSNTGQIKRKRPQVEFDSRFKYLVEDILNDRLNSRNYNGDKEQNEYFIKNLNDKFDLTSEPLEEAEDLTGNMNEVAIEEVGDGIANVKIKGKNLSNTISYSKLFNDYNWCTSNSRIDELFQSLQKVNHKTNLDMVAVTFRCYLDMIIYEYLKKKECIIVVAQKENDEINKENDKQYKKTKEYLIRQYGISEEEIIDDELRKYIRMFPKRDTNFAPSLHKMLSYIASNPELLPDARQREALMHFMNNESVFLSLKSFNLLIHNQNFNTTTEQLRGIVKNLLPLLCHVNNILASE